MPQLTDKEISKVYFATEGYNEEKGYEWKLYNFYIKGAKNKFSVFVSGNRPAPEEGKRIAYMEFDNTPRKAKDGKMYPNNIVNTIKYAEEPPSDAQNQTTINDQGIEQPKAFINHGDCVVRLMELAKFNNDRLTELIDMFKDGIRNMTNGDSDYNPYADAEEQGNWQKKQDELNPPPMPEDDIPF